MCLVWLKICSRHWIRTPQTLLQRILIQYSSCILNYNCRTISGYILYFATCTNFAVLIFTHKHIEIHSLTGIVLALLLQYMSQNNTSAISYIGFAHQIPYVSTTQGLAVTYLKTENSTAWVRPMTMHQSNADAVSQRVSKVRTKIRREWLWTAMLCMVYEVLLYLFTPIYIM